jgi:hypothetical protein
MHPFWLITGSLVILMGMFNKPLLHLFGLKHLSEVFTTPTLKRSSRTIEQITRWLVIVIGASFLVQGLGEMLPGDLSGGISAVLLVLSCLLLIAMFAIALATWKPR